MTDRIDGDAIRGRPQGQSLQQEPSYWQAHPAFQAPNANAYAERLVRSIKHECLSRVIPFGDRHLRRIFFATEVWTARGLTTFYTVFVIELHSRRVQIAGATPHPDQAFVLQVLRHLTAANEGLLGRHPQRLGGLLSYYYRAA